MRRGIKQQMWRVSFKSWLGSWPKWGVIMLLLLALGVAVRSIEQAQWITPQPSLTLVLVLAVLTGWLMCQSRLPAIVIHLLAVVLGVAVTLWQASNLLPSPELTSRVSQLATALQSWWQAVSAAKPSEGTVHFAVFLIFFTWLMGYISTWFILRRQNAWVAVALGALTILLNLGNLPQEYYTFFLFYALAALLLVGQTSLTRQHYWFKKQDITTYPNRGVIYLMASLLGLSLLAVSAAWLTPEVRVERLETMLTTKTLWTKNIEEHFNNLLAAVPAKQSFLKSEDQGKLLFGDSFGQGDELQFVIVSDRPYYWRSRMYDTYTSSGWTSSNATKGTLSQGIPEPQNDVVARRRQITYTVVAKVRTDILLTGGEFISAGAPVSVRRLASPTYNIDLLHPSKDRSLPEDVASLARSLRTVQEKNREISLDRLWQLLPSGMMLTDFTATRYKLTEDEDTQTPIPVSAYLTTVAVTRTQSAMSDIVAVTSLFPLKPDRHYAVTASASSATAEELSRAGVNYPSRITDYYLQLPPTLPERVRQLSVTVTKEAKTPYDKALAIKRYLTQFTYTLEVKAPPQGVDGVDHFLFTQKSGNCVQFASAMTVMLRSVGVPTRFSSGYSPGEWDATSSTATLRAKNRHTWPEVYFPGYGWIGFEATPPVDSEFEAIAGIGSTGGTPTLEEPEDEGPIGDIGVGSTGTSSVAAPSQSRWGVIIFFAIVVTI
ncbi:MAG: transglutaminase domain-containing protein, partial [Chloroflexi bacterium]|nr:transglutaminase domain-containing protein [Chloroflexota bacterium]